MGGIPEMVVEQGIKQGMEQGTGQEVEEQEVMLAQVLQEILFVTC